MATGSELQSALDEVQARLFDAYGPDAEMTRRERAICEATLSVVLKLIEEAPAEEAHRLARVVASHGGPG